MEKKIVILLLLLFSLCNIAHSDTIYLKSGGKVSGTVIEETQNTVEVKTTIGTITLEKSNIENIEKEKPAEEVKVDEDITETEVKSNNAELPMYGGQHEPKVEENKEASASAAKLGWEYYHRGDIDTAIKRFNQAWMFDRKNVDAFWGFGLVMGQRASQENPEHNLRESVRYLQIAKSLSQNNPRLLVDLAFSHTILGYFLQSEGRPESKEEFIQARKLFEKAEMLDPKYPLLHSNWSVLEFYVGDYTKAKTRLDHAKQLGFKPDPAYENDLESKLKQQQ